MFYKGRAMLNNEHFKAIILYTVQVLPLCVFFTNKKDSWAFKRNHAVVKFEEYETLHMVY